MLLAFFFARRYLNSAKSHSVINVISWVAAVAVGTPVAAMIVLLSVFNGFEGLVSDMYGEFDAEIAVRPTQGKTLDADITRERLLRTDGVEQVAMTLEGEVLLSYRGRQREAALLGVDSLYDHIVPIDSMVVAGEWRLRFGELQQAVVGAGVAYDLNINVALYDPVELFVPRRGSFSTFIPVDAYRTGRLYPAGVFALDAATDGRYVLAPLAAVQELLDYPGGVSQAMIKTTGDPAEVQKTLRRELGSDVQVLTRYEQKASLYAVMKAEKWGIFLIILLVMVIASFAIVGSLVMLVIDKQADLQTLRALGGDRRFLRSIFVREGMMIAGLGAGAGLAVGLAVCWAQQTFALIKIPARTFLVEAYPVVVRPLDIALVAVSFLAVNYIITKFTVAKTIR